jgi:hypothetical protein
MKANLEELAQGGGLFFFSFFLLVTIANVAIIPALQNHPSPISGLISNPQIIKHFLRIQFCHVDFEFLELLSTQEYNTIIFKKQIISNPQIINIC